MTSRFRGSLFQIVLFTVILSLLAAQGGCFWKKKVPKEELSARELYEKGLALAQKKKYEEARELFNKAKVASPEANLELLAQIAVGDSYFEEEEYEAARAQYEEIFKLHSGADVADYLQYRIGECFFWQTDTVDRDPTNAKEALKAFDELLETFPDSEYIPRARLRINEAHHFLAENEFFIGEFYLRKNAYFAAINRFKKALDLYPESGIQDKLIFYLYRTYTKLKDEEHAEVYQRLLMEQYPNSEYVPGLKSGPGESQITGSESWRSTGEGTPLPAPPAVYERSGAAPPVSPPPQAVQRGPENAPPGTEQRASLPIELAGTYQGKDRNTWQRKILLLPSGLPVAPGAAAPDRSPGAENSLIGRSFADKLIPW